MTDFTILTKDHERKFMDLLRPDQFGNYGSLVRMTCIPEEHRDDLRVRVLKGDDYVRIKTKVELPLEMDGPMADEYLKRYERHKALRWPMNFGDIEFDLNKYRIPEDRVAKFGLEYNYVFMINAVKILTWKTK